MPQSETQTEVVETDIQLNLTTIVNAYRVIEAAINKGAFNAQELVQILPIYQELNAYLLAQETRSKNETSRKE